MSIPPELYRHRLVLQREAEVTARFKHPVTDAPMLTYYQTSLLAHENPEFFSISEKEFHGAFEPKG